MSLYARAIGSNNAHACLRGVARIKVITWNLGHWQYGSRHNEAWSYLRNEIRPDLALLQEVSHPKLIAGEYFVLRPVHGNWGTAVYTRNMPTEELAFEGYSGRVVIAEIETSAAQKLVVASVHAPIIDGRVFPYLSEIFGKIEEIASKRSFVVGGDLNTARLAETVWPGHGHGPFWERIDAGKSLFFDCHRKFHDVEQQTFFRPGSRHPFQDDHLFTSYDLADRIGFCDVVDNTITRSLSDHIPIIAEIDL